jgi:hypothetical protein
VGQLLVSSPQNIIFVDGIERSEISEGVTAVEQPPMHESQRSKAEIINTFAVSEKGNSQSYQVPATYF